MAVVGRNPAHMISTLWHYTPDHVILRGKKDFPAEIKTPSQLAVRYSQRLSRWACPNQIISPKSGQLSLAEGRRNDTEVREIKSMTQCALGALLGA